MDRNEREENSPGFASSKAGRFSESFFPPTRLISIQFEPVSS